MERVWMWVWMAIAGLGPMVAPGGARCEEADEFRVLPSGAAGAGPTTMMVRYVHKHIDAARARWRIEYEGVKTVEEMRAYQEKRRRYFLEAIGGLPERTPLHPQIVGVVWRQGYRVEKIIFQSQPGHYVTALLYVPDEGRHRPPYPGVLVPCGHHDQGKGSDLYRLAGASLALKGMAALVFDPIDQGERGQLLGPDNKPPIWGTQAHTMEGIGSILLGRNIARFEIWDAMRAVDYLQSRTEVDGSRIGCTGNSGGGTQTAYLMALDDRIKAAAPSCYLTDLSTVVTTIGPQDAEQNIFGQLAFGMGHADYVMMTAPRPVLLCGATQDFFPIAGLWGTFRDAKRFYSRWGVARRLDLIEHDATHGFARPLREAAVGWMGRWLLGRDEAVEEPEIELLTPEEYRCTPVGQVMLLEGARSVYDLNIEYEETLSAARREKWDRGANMALWDEVRQITGISKLADLPMPSVTKGAVIDRQGYRIQKLVLTPETGIDLPGLLYVPEAAADRKILYIHERGKLADAGPGGAIETLVRQGNIVLAVDVRGTGETRAGSNGYLEERIGRDGRGVFEAYLLGRSYVGMRANDILVCAGYLTNRVEAGEVGGVALAAVGQVGVPALHAAALEPQLFNSLRLSGTLVAWSMVIRTPLTKNQLVNAVHGALRVYDLPDLAATLGEKLTVVGAVDALARPLE